MARRIRRESDLDRPARTPDSATEPPTAETIETSDPRFTLTAIPTHCLPNIHVPSRIVVGDGWWFVGGGWVVGDGWRWLVGGAGWWWWWVVDGGGCWVVIGGGLLVMGVGWRMMDGVWWMVGCCWWWWLRGGCGWWMVD
ncbi:hypothetical protein DPMN_174442, partial [Dreissena polymorpha]